MKYIEHSYAVVDNVTENQALLHGKSSCDKYDYLAAVACGVVGGVIDIFLVGAPGESLLGNWTDKQVDAAVMGFARKMGWNPKEKNIHNVNSAIGFLEGTYKVNYDQRKPSDVGSLFTMSPSTHHMMSLAHSPDIVGLFFSILNQFTSTSSFVSGGRLVTVSADTLELKGGNFLMKIMCGIANWFGHIMSDIAGSSGTHSRGTGVVIPFYEFFGFCKFGSFTTANGKKDLAEIAMSAFTQGYDFRFGMAQAIPLVVTELSIRLLWALRQRFQHHKPMKECIPTMKHPDLRVMLLVGNGTLCVMDGIDAGIGSGGNFLAFFTRLNIIAWFRFVALVLKEVCIRAGLTGDLTETIEAFKHINEVLCMYLEELKAIDLQKYKKETEEYHKVMQIVENAKTDKELQKVLLDTYEQMEWEKPWNGDFDAHMSDKNATLKFE